MKPQQREDEFREYVLRRRPELLRTATLLAAGDGHLGEDLVQIALTKLYLAWPRVRSETRDAYLHRTLVHALIDNKRWHKRRPESPTDALPEHPLPEPTDADPGQHVRDALAALPARMRAAVVLRHWMDLDVDATAAALGCSAGTVRSQSARGLDKLRALLGPHLTFATTGGSR